jgi:ribonuclease HI
MTKKGKSYVVWVGRVPGVYPDWDSCKAQTDGFTGAKFKSFSTEAEAQEAFTGGNEKPLVSTDKIITRSISVDAAWNNVSKDMEYQGVYTDTKELIFKQGPYADGTNNVGEFLAIVHALSYCKKHNINLPIYSDSKTALAWLRDKKLNSSLARTDKNVEIFAMLDRAVKWIKDNSYNNPVLKWETASWGEIPADFGRK